MNDPPSPKPILEIRIDLIKVMVDTGDERFTLLLSGKQSYIGGEESKLPDVAGTVEPFVTESCVQIPKGSKRESVRLSVV